MKIKNIVLSAAVAVGAAVNVYLANDIRELTNNFSLLNLENIAEAQEGNPGDAGGYVEDGVPNEWYPREAFDNEWCYINGQKTRASGYRVYLEIDCEGSQKVNCQPAYHYLYSVID